MNGFTEHGLDEDAFGEKGNLVSAFDAFRKFAIGLKLAFRGTAH
jgi:hypothetical protein